MRKTATTRLGQVCATPALLAAAAVGCGGGATTFAHQSGTIVSFGTTAGVAGVEVALGLATGTTDATGRYDVGVRGGLPYEMILTAPEFLTVISQRWQIADDVDRGATNLVPASQWASFIPAFESLGGAAVDPSLGFVALAVTALPSCPTVGGATVSIAPAGDSTRVLYTDDGGAASAHTSTSALPLSVHAIIYNVPVGPVTATIESPSCPQAPWPVTTSSPAGGTYTDTGAARVESGSAISYMRVYLGS
jgi:hypothetical protein